jgi:hypothetical protein
VGSTRDRSRLRAAALAAILALVLAASGARAKEEDQVETETPVPGQEAVPVPLGPRTGVRVYGEEFISVLADFGPAEVSEFRSNLAIRSGLPLSESFALRLTIAGHASFFDYSGNENGLETELGGIDLFERLYGARFGLGAVYLLPFQRSFFGVTPRWSLFTEGRATLAWENGAALSDAVKGSGAFGVGFEIDPTLELALGVDVGSSIDDDGVNVSPVFGFRWRFCEDARLESRGTGLLLAYDLTPEIELQLRGSYDSDRYRLDDGDPALMLTDLTLRKREAPVLVAVRWRPTPHWRLAVGAGSVVHQVWKVESDEEEGPSSKVKAGPSALTWFRVEYRF